MIYDTSHCIYDLFYFRTLASRMFTCGQMEADNVEESERHIKNIENHSNAPSTSASINSDDCGETDFKQELEEERFSPEDFLSSQMESDNVDDTESNLKKLENHANAPSTSTSISRMFTCDICDRVFININGLNAHKGVHVAVKRFSCEICNKQFTRSKTLNAHKKIYHNDGEKPFNCDECKKAFISNSDLTKHKRIHTGEKPYSCIVCLKTFAQPGHLTSHLRIHTGERPFKCSECDKTFSASSSLDKHKRSHTGEKPYYCNVCYKSFNSSSWLSKHNRTERHLKKLAYANSIGAVSQTMPLSLYDSGVAQFKQVTKKEGVSPEDFLSVQMESDNVEENGNHPKMLDDASNKNPTNTSINFVDCGEAVIKQEIEEEEFSPGIGLSDQMEAGNFVGGNHFKVQKKVIKKEKQYPCYLCQKSFNSSSHLSRHKKTIQHLSKLEAGNVDGTESNIENHANALPNSPSIWSDNHGEADIKQEIEEGFSPENFLAVQMEGNNFVSGNHFPVQKEINKIKKQYPCYVCQKSFNSSSNLSRHKKTIQHLSILEAGNGEELDHGEAVFKEEIEEEGFSAENFLSVHMETDIVEETEGHPNDSDDCGEADFKQEIKEGRFCPADFPSGQMEADNVDDTESNLKNIENQANTLTTSASISSDDCGEADFNQEIKEERFIPADFPSGQIEADCVDDTESSLEKIENHSNDLSTSGSISLNDCGEAVFKQDIEEERFVPADFSSCQLEAETAKESTNQENADKEEI